MSQHRVVRQSSQIVIHIYNPIYIWYNISRPRTISAINSNHISEELSGAKMVKLKNWYEYYQTHNVLQMEV